MVKVKKDRQTPLAENIKLDHQVFLHVVKLQQIAKNNKTLKKIIANFVCTVYQYLKSLKKFKAS